MGSRDDESGLREPRDQFAKGGRGLGSDPGHRAASAKLEGTRLRLRRKTQLRALVAGRGGAGSPQQRPLRGRGRENRAVPGVVGALGRSGPGRPRDSPNHRLRALQGPRGHSETRPRTCERRGASVGAQGPQPGPFPPGPPPVWVQAGQPLGGLQPGQAERVPSPMSSGALRLRGDRGHVLSTLGRRSLDGNLNYHHCPDGETEARRGEGGTGSQGDASSPPRSPNSWAGLNHHPPPVGTKDPDTE